MFHGRYSATIKNRAENERAIMGDEFITKKIIDLKNEAWFKALERINTTDLSGFNQLDKRIQNRFQEIQKSETNSEDETSLNNQLTRLNTLKQLVSDLNFLKALDEQLFKTNRIISPPNSDDSIEKLKGELLSVELLKLGFLKAEFLAEANAYQTILEQFKQLDRLKNRFFNALVQSPKENGHLQPRPNQSPSQEIETLSDQVQNIINQVKKSSAKILKNQINALEKENVLKTELKEIYETAATAIKSEKNAENKKRIQNVLNYVFKIEKNFAHFEAPKKLLTEKKSLEIGGIGTLNQIHTIKQLLKNIQSNMEELKALATEIKNPVKGSIPSEKNIIPNIGKHGPGNLRVVSTEQKIFQANQNQSPSQENRETKQNTQLRKTEDKMKEMPALNNNTTNEKDLESIRNNLLIEIYSIIPDENDEKLREYLVNQKTAVDQAKSNEELQPIRESLDKAKRSLNSEAVRYIKEEIARFRKESKNLTALKKGAKAALIQKALFNIPPEERGEALKNDDILKAFAARRTMFGLVEAKTAPTLDPNESNKKTTTSFQRLKNKIEKARKETSEEPSSRPPKP